ncbi:hypothetical protein C2E23DRAFT_85803 [Lenzites betulinus]|nr:hypothetical protein C2E23DRAFT_85803 [Lenzites betulinus]
MPRDSRHILQAWTYGAVDTARRYAEGTTEPLLAKLDPKGATVDTKVYPVNPCGHAPATPRSTFQNSNCLPHTRRGCCTCTRPTGASPSRRPRARSTSCMSEGLVDRLRLLSSLGSTAWLLRYASHSPWCFQVCEGRVLYKLSRGYPDENARFSRKTISGDPGGATHASFDSPGLSFSGQASPVLLALSRSLHLFPVKLALSTPPGGPRVPHVSGACLPLPRPPPSQADPHLQPRRKAVRQTALELQWHLDSPRDSRAGRQTCWWRSEPLAAGAPSGVLPFAPQAPGARGPMYHARRSRVYASLRACALPHVHAILRRGGRSLHFFRFMTRTRTLAHLGWAGKPP